MFYKRRSLFVFLFHFQTQLFLSALITVLHTQLVRGWTKEIISQACNYVLACCMCVYL